jgi:hypothetical protein
MPPISMQADYVLIIEWLNTGDQRTGAMLRDKLQARQLRVEFVECRRPSDVCSALTRARESIKDCGIPIVHIESHGDDPQQVTLKERAFGTHVDSISWKELGQWMSPLNQASDFNILLVGASCWGLSAAGTFRLHEAAPFVGCIGFISSVVESSLRDAMSELYRSLLVEHQDIPSSVASANRELHRADEALAFTSAPRLAMMVAMNTYKTIVSESSFDEIQPHLTKVARSPGMATQDLSESTWKAKREEVAKRLMGKVWTEWFPQTLQTRSPAYQLDWGSLAQDVGLGF